MDANLNRAREGLRALEDIARFVLNDGGLSGRLKDMRHRLAVCDPGRAAALLSARDVAGDRSAFLDTEAEASRGGLFAVLEANAKRAQESLRVLEELGKLLPQGPATFKKMRFALYDVEREMASLLLRREKATRIKGLYVIIDGQNLGGHAEVELARQALAGGASVIQLRDKARDKGQLLPLARQLRALCRGAGALFIVNDHVDLALAAEADGVHLGQKDLPVPVARRMSPIDALVGCSANNVEEALAAREGGADYVAVGAIYPTSTKADIRRASPQVLRAVREALDVPVVAIGGIDCSNVAEVVKAGADAVAVISAVAGAQDPEGAARALVEALREAHG